MIQDVDGRMCTTLTISFFMCRAVSNNKFSGSIQTLGKLVNLTKLYVERNGVVRIGCVHIFAFAWYEHCRLLFQQCTRSAHRDVGSNMFNGTIDALGNLTQLSELYVREH